MQESQQDAVEAEVQEEAAAVTTVFVDDRATKKRLRRSQLVVTAGPDKGKTLVIERERVTVGRSPVADLSLSDKAVSGAHFAILAADSGFLLQDLDSTNGTECDALKVREVWLRPGTMIRIGQSEMRFEPAEGTVDIDLSAQERFQHLVGKSVQMREVFAVLEKVAPSELTVLVRGETGTGKELVAQAVHQASRRAEGPFVVQDCGTIAKELIESTLFGHERGAFTGATERHKGSFEQADGGTIFLDEIGELDIHLQPKLLRVLESREIKRVGGDKTIPIDVRVVAATHRDLRQMVDEGTFREDLYYRLTVVQVELPPLRERPGDIPLLVERILADLSRRRFSKHSDFEVTAAAIAELQAYSWPGNVRELRNCIERAVSLADAPVLEHFDVLPHGQQLSAGIATIRHATQYVEDGLPFKAAKQQVLDAFEAAYLRLLLDKHRGNITRSAQAAGLTRYHLRELAKRYGIRGTAE
ncbi:MAG: sigma 54-interacting transcriptional regulator [Polyangiales bacterium]